MTTVHAESTSTKWFEDTLAQGFSEMWRLAYVLTQVFSGQYPSYTFKDGPVENRPLENGESIIGVLTDPTITGLREASNRLQCIISAADLELGTLLARNIAVRDENYTAYTNRRVLLVQKVNLLRSLFHAGVLEQFPALRTASKGFRIQNNGQVIAHGDPWFGCIPFRDPGHVTNRFMRDIATAFTSPSETAIETMGEATPEVRDDEEVLGVIKDQRTKRVWQVITTLCSERDRINVILSTNEEGAKKVTIGDLYQLANATRIINGQLHLAKRLFLELAREEVESTADVSPRRGWELVRDTRNEGITIIRNPPATKVCLGGTTDPYFPLFLEKVLRACSPD